MTPYIKKSLEDLGVEFDQELYDMALAIAKKRVERFPWSSVSRILLRNSECPAYPGLSGTGFFCRMPADPDSIFFVTARHCIANELELELDASFIANTVVVPFCSDHSSEHDDGDVKFEALGQIWHGNNDKPGRYEDLLVLRVSGDITPQRKKSLFNRALILPSSMLVREQIDARNIQKALVIGCPLIENATTSITYQENDGSVDISFNYDYFSGMFSEKASYPDRHSIELIKHDADLNGFSGSPVLWEHINGGVVSYLFVGMVVTGNKDRAEFLSAEVIVNKINEMACVSLF